MPLKGNFKKDMAELIATNHMKKKKRPMKQMQAIAYSEERKKGK